MDALRVLPDEDAILDEAWHDSEPERPSWLLSTLPAISLILFFLVLRAVGGSAGPNVVALLEPGTSPGPSSTEIALPQILPFASSTEIRQTETPSAETRPTEAPTFGPPEAALWPFARRGLRFEQPVDVAASFAKVFIGFADPIVGPYRPLDRDYGEVEIRSAVDGPVTRVQVHRFTEDRTWWVTGATSSNISLDKPDFGATIDDPLYVSGTALVERGQVHVELRAAGVLAPVLQAVFVTNGGLQRDWFEGAFGWTHPGSASGAMVVVINDAERGEVLEAVVLPVTLAPVVSAEPGV